MNKRRNKKLNFINDEYNEIIGDLLGDALYAMNSNRGKIMSIRSYTEVVVRKIIDYNPDKKIMLGDICKKGSDAYEYASKKLSDVNLKRLRHLVTLLTENGNKAVHTKERSPFSDEQLNKTIDVLYELLSFLFIDYFQKNIIDSTISPQILEDFSLLPPEIRYKSLIYVYENNYRNVYIADKLCLASLKYLGKKDTLKWLEKEKYILQKQEYPDDSFKEELRKKGPLTAELVISMLPKNAYELCLEKIGPVSAQIEDNGLLYKEFEEAKAFYLNNKKQHPMTSELISLHDLMDFVYIGRKVI